uniref:(northern house mosquito) hypothetical protein n=1 Tax=Culex pipiens TaxID=7175 RepID=A0A8D8BB25_CULPI
MIFFSLGLESLLGNPYHFWQHCFHYIYKLSTSMDSMPYSHQSFLFFHIWGAVHYNERKKEIHYLITQVPILFTQQFVSHKFTVIPSKCSEKTRWTQCDFISLGVNIKL